MNNATRRQLDIASRSSIFTYAISAVIIPVSLLAIIKELGFTLTQAGSLSLIATIVQFSILLGAIPAAAKTGKIRLLRWGLWILAAGLAAFTRINSFGAAVLVILIIGLGQAVLEALLTPLVEDIHPEDDGSNQAFLHAFWPFGVIFGTLVIGEALTRGVSWRTVFLILGILCIAVGSLYPRRSRANLPRSRADFSHAGEILRKPVFWMMGAALFFAGGTEGGFTYWSASYIQIEYGTLARAGGLGTAFFSFGMAIGRLLASRIMSRFGIKRILISAVLFALAGGIAFYFVRTLPLLYIDMVIMGTCIGPFWPGVQTYAVRRIGGDPTMIMVFLSCFGITGFSSATFIMGIIGDHAGLRTSFLAAPAYLAALFVILLVENRLCSKTETG